MSDRPAYRRSVLVSRCVCALFGFLALCIALPCAASINLQQASGAILTLPAPAKRIITLAPNLAELVFAAGAGARLKAVVEYSNFPPQVTQIPRVGDAFRIDLERVIELEPDLVIAWKSGNPQTALQKLTQLGITVWQIEITRPEEMIQMVESIALAAGTQNEGRARARQLSNTLENLRRQNKGKTPVDYFFQIAPRPLYTINGQHIISRSLEICGGHNVFFDLSTLAPQISRESVILANPRVMIAPATSTDSTPLDIWGDWPHLQAVQKKTLLYLPADEISQATPRLLDSVELACKLLDEVRTSANLVGKP